MNPAASTSAVVLEPMSLDARTLAAFCRRHRVTKLSVFGSFARGEQSPESDLDLLVEFEPEARFGYIALAGMELELQQIAGRSVDFRTIEELSKYIRDRVLREAKVIYVH